MTSIYRDTVVEAIKRQIAITPKLGQNAILEQVRAKGYKIANVRGRSVIKYLREQAERDVSDLAQRIGFRSGGETDIELIPDERFVRDFGQQFSDELARDIVKSQETFVIQRGTPTRVSTFTHIVITWQGGATARVYDHHGGLLDEIRESNLRASLTVRLSNFRLERISDRISNQIRGILARRFSELSGVAFDPFNPYKGVVVEIRDVHFNIVKMEGRGNA